MTNYLKRSSRPALSLPNTNQATIINRASGSVDTP